MREATKVVQDETAAKQKESAADPFDKVKTAEQITTKLMI